ncbi:MAG: hypothetical protein KAH00_08765 [Cocleimonas sp.]|nr:hypothetical protein [Cocleimonas sp.]
MKPNNPLLITSLLTLLASPIVFAGDDATGTGQGEGGATNGETVGDTQTATIVVPEVSLIDVTNTVEATLIAPQNAGDNFSAVSVTKVGGGNPDYDISANISAISPQSTTRKIVATSSNIPLGWKFNISMVAPTASGASAGIVSLTNGTTTVDMVTGIKNVAEKTLGMTIEIAPESANTMPSYTTGTGQAATIVYTITADS